MIPSVKNARKFAIGAHDGQMYGDEFPYKVHLGAAVSVLAHYEISNPVLKCAVWLHDTLEDTDTTYNDLVMYFGSDVADVVSAVTKPEGMTRREADKITLPRIRADWRAVIVKLCDRISHVESGGKKVGMYVKEHTAFKGALITAEIPEMFQDVVNRMWARLDRGIMECARESKSKETSIQ
jgi:(p)ppGpp synthase/HD superfamily hydrolase